MVIADVYFDPAFADLNQIQVDPVEIQISQILHFSVFVVDLEIFHTAQLFSVHLLELLITWNGKISLFGQFGVGTTLLFFIILNLLLSGQLLCLLISFNFRLDQYFHFFIVIVY